MVNWLNSMFHKILLLIDAAVYWFVSMCYQLFVRMATLQLFDDAFFGEFANRIYAILGVFIVCKENFSLQEPTRMTSVLSFFIALINS